MDRIFEKLHRLILDAVEQLLVATLMALYLIAFALLTAPGSTYSLTALCGLAWDQLSSPSPHAPAGDLNFWMIRFWTNHLIHIEFPRLRHVAIRFGSAGWRWPSFATRGCA